MVGEPADGRPWAEWWMGTHPLAPSTLDDGSALDSVAGDLPYLLKFMAAAQPLSLQTHPDKAQAQVGFEFENRSGIPVDAATRIYRDRSAKPEMLCALTSFDTLCGFRPVDDTLALLSDIGAHDLAHVLQDEKLPGTVAALYRGEFDPSPTIDACRRHDRPEANLVTELDATYPGDPSVAITLLLNRVMLTAGEAIFLGPGNLHAYLRGFGVEVMANSDNVVRGGLTVKHINVDELLTVLDFEPLADPRVQRTEIEPGRWRYETASAPFVVSRIELDEHPRPHTAIGRQLVLWVDGPRHGECDYLAPGDSVELTGPATVFVVDEP
jgi:mannose-6-phosphate isomerase